SSRRSDPTQKDSSKAKARKGQVEGSNPSRGFIKDILQEPINLEKSILSEFKGIFMLDIFEDRVNRLTGYKALHGFALGLVGIFIPIFIAQQGFSASTVFSFLLADVASFTFFALPVGWLVSKIGVRNSLLSSSLLYILVFILLQTISLNFTVIYSVAVLIGLAKAFNWIPVNSEFTAGSEEDDRGRNYGKLEGIPKILSPFAPLIGALIMTKLGFSFLVAFSLFFAIGSVMPLLFGDGTKNPDFQIENKPDLSNRDLWALYYLDGFATTAYVFIFPLFIYYVIGGTVNVGSVKTLMGIGAGIFSLTIGNLSDRIEQKNLLLAGAIASSLIYLAVPSLNDIYLAFGLSFVAGLTYTVYTVPLISIVADIAEKKNLLGFYSTREIFQGIGKISVVGLIVYIISSYSIDLAFKTTFYLAALSVLALAGMSRKVDKRRQ
ncbi:MAG: MFS transporter, partial [Candidatus Nanohaloarchaea archaeon]